MRRFVEGQGAGAAIEFALIAPILVFGALSAADLGFAVNEAFKVDQALRSGAEAALTDPGESEVRAVLVAAETAGDAVVWTVDRVCACPESRDAPVDCSTTCADDRPTSIFYEVGGATSYDGLFLPTREIARAATVQVR